ncbi:MAG TPA: hypothetical protein VK638_05440, partial [Edaphobacter sp.]|nr:hypothetical protein [Edaphobacter sp.]
LHGIAPSPKRKQSSTWSEFIRSHMDVQRGRMSFLPYLGSNPGDPLTIVEDCTAARDVYWPYGR